MLIKLFRQPLPGELTVIGADPSEGGDYCAAVAKSKKHADSFMTLHGKLDSAQFGYELLSMARYIELKTREKPLIAVERNTGAATIHVLTQANYPRLFRMPKLNLPGHEEDNRIGWSTNAASRPKMLDELSLALKQRITRIYDMETIKELMSFILDQRTGKPQAAYGANDDLVMAEAIAWQAYQITPVSTKEGLAARMAMFTEQKIFDDFGVPNV